MFGFRNKTKENTNNNKEIKISYRIREEQYNLSTARFYPEYCIDDIWITWNILSYKNIGLNINGKDYCDSYESALSIIEKYKKISDNKLIKEIIHEIE